MKKMKKLSACFVALSLVSTPLRPVDPRDILRDIAYGSAVIAIAAGVIYLGINAPDYCPECGLKIEKDDPHYTFCNKWLHKHHPYCYAKANGQCKACEVHAKYVAEHERKKTEAQQIADDHALAQEMAQQESSGARGGGYVSPGQANKDQCEVHGERFAGRDATHESARAYGSTTPTQTTNRQTDAHGSYYAQKVDQQQRQTGVQNRTTSGGKGSAEHAFTQEEMQEDCQICYTGKLCELDNGTAVNLNDSRYKNHVSKIPCRCNNGKGRWFHTACLKQWAKTCRSKNQNPRCPLCKDQFNEKNVFKNS